MICNCNVLLDDYSLEIVQGDYLSVVYTLTDEYGNNLDDIKQVVFTCEQLGLQQVLTKLSPTEFWLQYDGTTTANWSTFLGATYDITLELVGNATPLTLVHDASFTILKKENKLNADDPD